MCIFYINHAYSVENNKQLLQEGNSMLDLLNVKGMRHLL